MSKITPERRLTVHTELTQAVTAAMLAALAAGMTREDVAAAVTRCVELLEQEEE